MEDTHGQFVVFAVLDELTQVGETSFLNFRVFLGDGDNGVDNGLLVLITTLYTQYSTYKHITMCMYNSVHTYMHIQQNSALYSAIFMLYSLHTYVCTSSLHTSSLTSSLSIPAKKVMSELCFLGNLGQSVWMASTTTILNSSDISDMNEEICFISRSMLLSLPVYHVHTNTGSNIYVYIRE